MSQLQQQEYADDPVARNLDAINSRKTDQLIAKLAGASGGYVASMLSLYNGKIYLGNAFDDGVVHRRNMLVDVDKLREKKTLGASGKSEEAAHIEPFTDTMKGMLETYSKVDKIHQDYSIPVERILGAASTGIPSLQTEYELVRRITTLAEVKGPAYVMEVFNAINGVQVQSTTDLTVLGYARSAKLTGQKEIGDEQIPDLAKNTFAAYFKDIYADSFRYEFGMRELKQSGVNLEAQVTQDIPGAFAKLKDDKITALMNAIADTTPTTDWDALLSTYETHYTSDAAADIGDADNTLQPYGGAYAVFWPRATARAYRRNVNGGPLLSNNAISIPNSAETNRSWQLPLNEHLTGYINESITAATAVLVSKQWGILLQGPTIQVSYQNQFTPAQMQGHIYFDFNGVKEAVAAAAVNIVGLLS